MLDLAHPARAAAREDAPMRTTALNREHGSPAPLSGPVREALRGLFRAGRLPAEDAYSTGAVALPAPQPEAWAHAAEPACGHAVHAARAAAHAAYRAVVGGGPRALDAALAVAEAEARTLRLRCLAQEEALKLLRLYAVDDWARSVAAHALERPVRRDDLLAFLHDPDLAEGAPCRCGDHR
jgi:hypothetical protein